MFNSHDVHDLQGKQNCARYEGWVTVSWGHFVSLCVACGVIAALNTGEHAANYQAQRALTCKIAHSFIHCCKGRRAKHDHL